MKKAYETYKDSGIECIGDVPSYWELLPVRYYVTLVKGTKPKELTDINTGFPYLTMDYLRGRDGKTTMYPSSIDGLELIEENEILVLWDGANAGEFLLSKKGYLGSTMAKITVNPLKYDKQYFYFLLKTIEKVSKDYANGTTIPHFDSKVLTDYYYPCPSLVEQKAIAEFLDKKCCKIDSLVAELENQVADFEVLKKLEISRIVTKGLNLNVPLKDSGIEWIGNIPVDWECAKIKHLAKLSPRTEMPMPNTIISYMPMECLRNGKIVSRTIRLADASPGLNAFQNGDIVMAKVTPCFENGNIAIAENLQNGVAVGSSEVFVVRPINIDTKFLFYAFQNENFRLKCISTMYGTGGLKRIDSNFLNNVLIPYPSFAEQHEIAYYLDSYCEKVDAIVKEIQVQISDLKSYKQSLISEVVTGKIKIID